MLYSEFTRLIFIPIISTLISYSMCRIIDLINEDSVSADLVLARKIVENNLVAVYHFWVLSIPILGMIRKERKKRGFLREERHDKERKSVSSFKNDKDLRGREKNIKDKELKDLQFEVKEYFPEIVGEYYEYMGKDFIGGTPTWKVVGGYKGETQKPKDDKPSRPARLSTYLYTCSYRKYFGGNKKKIGQGSTDSSLDKTDDENKIGQGPTDSLLGKMDSLDELMELEQNGRKKKGFSMGIQVNDNDPFIMEAKKRLPEIDQIVITYKVEKGYASEDIYDKIRTYLAHDYSDKRSIVDRKYDLAIEHLRAKYLQLVNS